MRRRLTIVAAGAVATLGLAIPFAHAADGSNCPEGSNVAIHVDINGNAQDICLPPSGGTPTPPSLPALPSIPGLP